MIRNVFALLTVSAVAWCQAPDIKQMAADRLQAMVKELNLTEDQKSKILPILTQEAPKVKAIREDASLPQNEKVSRLVEIRNDTSAKISPILTPDQQRKLDQMKQQNRQRIMEELKAKGGI
jgi:Spy/CpxP family protein refolding chaperone